MGAPFLAEFARSVIGRQRNFQLHNSVSFLTMRRGRLLRWFVVLFLLYISLCAVAGIYLADGTLHPSRRILTEEESAPFKNRVRAMSAQLQDVSITAPNQTNLRGWLLRPAVRNGNAAILLHGLADNRLGMTGYAELLLAQGYTVLLPDARAHGASGGSLATFGLLERDDIRAWVDFVSADQRSPCIYGLGESMGAAQLLQ